MGHGVFELEPELLPAFPMTPWWCRGWWPFSGVSSRSSARRLRALALTRFVRLIRIRWKVLKKKWIKLKFSFINLLFSQFYLPTSILFTFLDLWCSGRCGHWRSRRTDATRRSMMMMMMMIWRRTKSARNAFQSLQFLYKMNFQIGRS
jgi:hypothetical protein